MDPNARDILILLLRTVNTSKRVAFYSKDLH